MKIRPLIALLTLLCVGLPQSLTSAIAGEAGRPNRPGYHDDLLLLSEGAGDPQTLVRRAMRDAVRALGSEDGAGAPTGSRRTLSDDDEWFEEEEVYLEAAGDLDGQPGDDAIETTYAWDDENPSLTARGIRRTNGDVLWTASGPDIVGMTPVGNLDGVHGDDVLFFESRSEGVRSDSSQTTYAADGATLLTVRAIRGTDGALIWSRTFASPFAMAETSPAGIYSEVAYTLPLAIGDTTGDGVVDLLLGHYHHAFGYSEDQGTAAVTAMFEIASGRTGLSGAVAPGTRGFGFPDAGLVPDLNGDAFLDVAVLAHGETTEPTEPGATLSAYPGRGGPPLWRVPIDLPSGWGGFRGLRLNGDAVGDVLFEITEFDEEAFGFGPTHLIAHSGTNGARLWATTITSESPVTIAGDATGDGGSDLLVFPANSFSFGQYSLQSSYGPPRVGPDVLLLSGSDGAQVWAKDAKRLVSVRPIGDVSADGAADVLLVELQRVKKKVRIKGVKKVRKVLVPVALTLSSRGATGVARIRLDKAKGFAYPAGGDLDRDGAADLLVFANGGSGDRYRAYSGRTGKPFWGGFSAADYLLSLDTASTGAGGVDLLETSWGNQGPATSARRGTDGAELWRRTGLD